jgi:hypothetical protein
LKQIFVRVCDFEFGSGFESARFIFKVEHKGFLCLCSIQRLLIKSDEIMPSYYGKYAADGSAYKSNKLHISIGTAAVSKSQDFSRHVEFPTCISSLQADVFPRFCEITMDHSTSVI